MSNVTLSVDDEGKVARAVTLLKMRQDPKSNAYKKVAIERKLKELDDRIIAIAEDRAKKVKAPKPVKGPLRATMVSATLNAVPKKDATPGHTMTFEMKIDVPKKIGAARVGTDEEGFARDLYGAFFEWWEEIVNDYDFVEPPVDPADATAVEERNNRIAEKMEAGEGGWSKPWSDIYLSNPQSMTFQNWKRSLTQATTGKLAAGVHTTSVVDKPGINTKANSFKRRTLRFRINAGDATGEKFKSDALQLLVVEDGKMLTSVYQDSMGTDLKEGEEDSEVMRYRSKVSPEIRRNEGNDFIVALETDESSGTPFDDVELTAVKAALRAQNLGATMLGDVHKSVNQSNQLNAMPLIPSGEKYYQTPSSDGGLLIAHVAGGKVKRLFHTTGETKDITVPVNGPKTDFTVRTFEQLPLN
jgi:hypothetical protein